MDLGLTSAEERFRDELRDFLGHHPPPPDTGFAAQRVWQQTLFAGGWVAPHWPADVGGRSADFGQYAIYVAELARVRAPQPANRVGINLAGPTLLAHGTDEHRRRHLAPILSAEEIWCQLFSEPDAGSDLGSLRTRAVPDGDGWRVTGQKVWTSYATEARFGILLARTADTADREGRTRISYFVCDMKSPGIEIRPLRQITGEAEFNEVFLTDVWLGPDALVGGLGDGWQVANTTLAHERGTAFPLKEQVVQRIFLEDLLRIAREEGVDPVLRDRLVRCFTDAEIFRFLNLGTLTRLARGQEPGPESSIVKLHWSGLSQRLHETEIELHGSAGVTTSSPHRDESAPWRELLWSRAASIAGGTSEIQRNIIGERLLGLPREPRAGGG
ncbi:MAG: acyl-CoA dehydrogenase family protein [Acidimicrobiia bacterium]|nr:acyl-CoA dehydrogenase family protein [Acidimicrobiia bacterium]